MKDNDRYRQIVIAFVLVVVLAGIVAAFLLLTGTSEIRRVR